MAKLNIIWTRTADLQFVGVLEYWINQNNSKSYSKKLIKLVEKRTNYISENPLMFKLAAFPETRAASMGNFTILYKVTKESIIITAFWDNRQDPKKLIEVLNHKKLL
jgi:hypothetical protein